MPCGFLWIFSILDYFRRRNSRYSHTPWAFLSVSKAAILVLLICVTFVDLAMTISTEETIYTSQYVALGIKIVTFVSLFIQSSDFSSKWNCFNSSTSV